MHQESLEDCLPLKGRWLGYFLRTLGWIGAACFLVLLWYSCLPYSFRGTKKGQVASAKTQISCFKTALDLYILDNGRVPTRQQGLDALVKPSRVQPLPRKWAGPYLIDVMSIPLDPWGNSYRYLPEDQCKTSYVIVSYGEDGKPGGSGYNADLTSSPD